MAQCTQESLAGHCDRYDWLGRDQVATALESSGFLNPDHQDFMHGRLVGKLTAAERDVPKGFGKPRAKWKSDKPPRSDHSAPSWLTATEWEDHETVMQEKVALLARLLRLSRKTVIYSGAGISVAANIRQAAHGASTPKKGKIRNSRCATPTATHYNLVELYGAGLIHGWVQQNHDGLPQKAGYPQQSINEIHGSWFDPSNPVVKYSGSLRSDLLEGMLEAAETADLAVVLGTSLSGLCADLVAETPAVKSLRANDYDAGGRLGTVIINLQQTPEDGKATLRINGTSDVVLGLLLATLSITTPRTHSPNYSPRVWETGTRVLVPYDRNGKRIDDKSKDGMPLQKMWLDLSIGARVKLNPKHNCQGAQQPAFLHIGRKKTKYRGRLPSDGTGRVVQINKESMDMTLLIGGANMHLGVWWIDAAQHGLVDRIPIINQCPKFEKF